MRTSGVLAAGVAVGLAAGLGGALALAPGTAASLAPPGAGPTGAAILDHTECARREGELSARVRELKAKLAALEGTTGGRAAPPAGPPAEAAKSPADPAAAKALAAADPLVLPGPGGARPQPGQDPLTPAQKLAADWTKRAWSVAADSPEKTALFRELRERLRDPDPQIAAAAAQALAMLARADKLTPADATDLRADYDSFPAGAPVRPGLAAAVARALSQDPSLATFLDSLPRRDEPQVRGQVLRALDGSPSEPFRQLVLRISAEDESPEALRVAWDEDRILASATRDFAPKLVAAIEPRIAKGGLPGEVRGLGYYAISIAGLQAPRDASAALARAAGLEKSPAHAGFASGLEKILTGGNATYAELEAYWDKNRRVLRDEAAAPAGR
ncbi:MAG: hypothetical protein L0216_22110 [Planctomycetales bacterium]|nr:hypothetical protein [Planctomycetales bacterium]